MTTNRMLNAVRKNPDFIAAKRLLEELGLAWELIPPRGKGHPILIIAEKVRWPVSISPSGRMRSANTRAHLKAKLKERGLI